MTTNLLPRTFLLIVATTYAAFAVPAAAFTFQDDPSSKWSGDSSTTSIFAGNTFTWHDLFAQNTTSNPLPELRFALPFIWPEVSSSFIPLEWRNDLNGWNANDFNSTGTSLTVTLTGPIASSIAMRDLADLTGAHQLPLTEPCTSGSPSCTSGPYPPESRNLSDMVPVISLGAFAPDETKRFDLTFTYSYGDQRDGALQTAFIGNTISAIAPIPEPETYAMFLAGLGLLGWRLRKA